MNRKFGKLAKKTDSRTLKLLKYLKPTLLQAPPESVTWSKLVQNWPMFANDTVGDCTCAGAGHMIQSWSSNASTPKVLTDSDILTAYSAISGYVPGNESTDNGAVELDVLNYWRQTGFAGDKIFSYVEVNIHNPQEVKLATYWFGGIYIGLALPNSFQDQTVWDVPSQGPIGDGAVGSAGGHCVPICDYSPDSLTCVTWGALQPMTWNFFDTYCDEAYAIVDTDWLNAAGETPSGLNLQAMENDLKEVTS